MGLGPIFYGRNNVRMGMGKVSEQLYRLLEPVINGLGYELVGIEWSADNRQHKVLRIYIDVEDGISVDDCELVSGQISAVLDVEDPIPGAYLLEVSSPGLDRPLFNLEHFRRFVGQPVKVTLSRPLDGRRRFQGTIDTIEDERIHLATDQGNVEIPLEQIEKARLVPDYQAILKG